MCKIGKVYVIGLGPGAEKEMTYQASTALEKSEVIIGYTVYTGLIRERFPDKKYLSTPMRQEVIRCEMAMDEAMKGSTVAMVCSGDAGIYGMAGILLEIANEKKDKFHRNVETWYEHCADLRYDSILASGIFALCISGGNRAAEGGFDSGIRGYAHL